MGLRGLLIALVMGSLALPSVIGLIVASFVSSGIDEGPSRRFSAVRLEVGRAVAPDGSGGLLAKKGYVPPEWLLLIVADREEKVVYTNVAGLRVGDGAGRMSGLLSQNHYAPPSSLATQKRAPTCFYVETVEQKGKILGTYYALVWPIDASRLDERRNPFFFLFFLLAFSLIAVIGAAGISALLARSVMRLERAAGRIASGDLETPVQERGHTRDIRPLPLHGPHARHPPRGQGPPRPLPRLDLARPQDPAHLDRGLPRGRGGRAGLRPRGPRPLRGHHGGQDEDPRGPRPEPPRLRAHGDGRVERPLFEPRPRGLPRGARPGLRGGGEPQRPPL